jgi:hypothetical protein
MAGTAQGIPGSGPDQRRHSRLEQVQQDMCPDSMKLHRIWWDTCTQLKPDMTPAQQQKLIELDRADPEYQAALMAVRVHNSTCPECRRIWADG